MQPSSCYIGRGSPGSTAGGIKTSTLAVLLLTSIPNIRQDIRSGGDIREKAGGTIHQAVGLHLTINLV